MVGLPSVAKLWTHFIQETILIIYFARGGAVISLAILLPILIPNNNNGRCEFTLLLIFISGYKQGASLWSIGPCSVMPGGQKLAVVFANVFGTVDPAAGFCQHTSEDMVTFHARGNRNDDSRNSRVHR